MDSLGLFGKVDYRKEWVARPRYSGKCTSRCVTVRASVSVGRSLVEGCSYLRTICAAKVLTAAQQSQSRPYTPSQVVRSEDMVGMQEALVLYYVHIEELAGQVTEVPRMPVIQMKCRLAILLSRSC